MDDDSGDIAGISALADPVRRRVYRYVCEQPAPVSRDQAAGALGMPRHQAAFHLDRLEDAGLLTTSYARLTGRVGPGAGRPAKVYQRRAEEIAVSLPARQYPLAGQILAGAVEQALDGSTPLAEALTRTAARRGQELANSARDEGTPLDTARAALATLGYEPRVEDGSLVLANCPFHSLAQEHTALVCGLNHTLLEGLSATIGGLRATLEPAPGRCCVVLHATGDGPAPGARPV